MAGRASQTDSASELDDFWTEMTAIEAGKGQETHSSDDELSRTPDGEPTDGRTDGRTGDRQLRRRAVTHPGR